MQGGIKRQDEIIDILNKRYETLVATCEGKIEPSPFEEYRSVLTGALRSIAHQDAQKRVAAHGDSVLGDDFLQHVAACDGFSVAAILGEEWIGHYVCEYVNEVALLLGCPNLGSAQFLHWANPVVDLLRQKCGLPSCWSVI